MKLTSLSLSELYEKPKFTAAVEANIRKLEDFTSINPTYCNKICKLGCKSYEKVTLYGPRSRDLDILIIQDHKAPNGKFDKRPGQTESKQQSIIDHICVKAGFTGLTYAVTTLLKCAPTETDFPQGKAPSVTKLMKCLPYLEQEIANQRPRVIISLSTAVTKALGYKKYSNSADRGQILDNKVVLTLHPRVLSMIRQNASGAMWSADYFNVILRDFQKAASMARGNLRTIPLLEGIEAQRKNITIARSLKDVEDIFNLYNGLSQVVSFDTETTGLDPYDPKAKLLCAQFGYREKDGTVKAHVIPLWHRENKAYDADKAWEYVKALLEKKSLIKVLHNGKFDYIYIYVTKKVRIEGFVFDTMLLLHDLDSGIQGCYSLKTAIMDHAPDLSISGYESLLPKLTKPGSTEFDPENPLAETTDLDEEDDETE